jgi:hypothetical protein
LDREVDVIDFTLTEEQEALRTLVRRFAQKEIVNTD